jgi:hypothetical protein
LVSNPLGRKAGATISMREKHDNYHIRL